MIYFQIQTKDGKSVAGNMNDFSRYFEFADNRTFSNHSNGKGIKGEEIIDDDIRVWVVAEDEADILKSSKLFTKTLGLYKRVACDVLKNEKEKLTAHSHTLTTIQGQIRQQIEGFADDSKFSGEKYSDIVKNINLLVAESTLTTADLLCYIHKRIADMRAHLLGVEVIHMGGQFEMKLSSVRLKRAILNQCTPFLKELEDKAVYVKFFFDDNHEVMVDKNMFSLVMYNFFSNAVKYARKGTEIRFNYYPEEGKMIVSMLSLKMEKDEIKHLFEETVRGRHAKDIPGNGIGLFALQRALELMGKKRMFISPDYSKTDTENGKTYVENYFEFFL